jgi:virginiamycin A acetyltransferase
VNWTQRVSTDHDVEVSYRQFDESVTVRRLKVFFGLLTWPVVLPLALISRASDFIFRTVSEMLSLVPFVFGVIVRYEFYRWTLTECGSNVVFGFGTVFFYRDIKIGGNVAIGDFNVIQHCDIGSYTLIADGCHFLSGRRYHTFDRSDVPIALQGGKLRRITLGEDCWVGASAIIMDNVGEGCVVGAGSVVTRAVEPYSIVAGNPAKVIRKRK